jgi:hypothetical protein
MGALSAETVKMMVNGKAVPAKTSVENGKLRVDFAKEQTFGPGQKLEVRIR